ncbi:hypothetical protein AAG570_007390 [Ranatra chinensis]|uniref:Chitin-binding type-2 domain-containing protein n=1 Tax=Ranatra chinensis TaxID=642074 RepID=A0ABD0XYE6_9HEMI
MDQISSNVPQPVVQDLCIELWDSTKEGNIDRTQCFQSEVLNAPCLVHYIRLTHYGSIGLRASHTMHASSVPLASCITYDSHTMGLLGSVHHIRCTLVVVLAVVGCVLAGCGKTGDRRPHPTSCRRYVECDKSGSWRVRSCNIFLKFDAPTKSCRVLWHVHCGKVSCVEGEKRPVPNQCKQYTECENGKTVPKKCSLLHGYDPKTQQCVYEYDCSGTPQCKDGARKMIPNDCKNYMVCKGGKFQKTSCSWPKKFDWKSLQCLYRADCPECSGWKRRTVKGGCKKFEECVEGRIQSKSCSFLHVTGKALNVIEEFPSFRILTPKVHVVMHTLWVVNEFFQRYTLLVGAFLAQGAVGCENEERVPHPDSCSKYVECQQGQWNVQSCSTFRRFDSVSKTCKFTGVTCGHPECIEGTTRPRTQKCEEYDECQDGNWQPVRCPMLHGYNPSTGNCQFRYDCSATPRCEEGAKRAIEGQCKDYFACTSGSYKRESCSVEKTFDPESLECRWGNYCERCKGWKVRPVQGHCSTYEVCSSDGVVQPRECPVFQKFDPNELRCTWTWNVECPQDPNRPNRNRKCPGTD